MMTRSNIQDSRPVRIARRLYNRLAELPKQGDYRVLTLKNGMVLGLKVTPYGYSLVQLNDELAAINSDMQEFKTLDQIAYHIHRICPPTQCRRPRHGRTAS